MTFRNTAINTGLVVAACLFTLFAIEKIFLSSLHLLPLKHHVHLPEYIQPLAQPTKQGTIPKDHILVLGDSYAKGYGDWLYNSDFDTNPAFHSGDVIASQTNRDLITIGKSGAGSIRGLIYQPAAFSGTTARAQIHIPTPKDVLIYFYEGNDLNNNMKEARKLDILLENKPSMMQIESTLNSYYGQVYNTHYSEKEECTQYLSKCFFMAILNTKTENHIKIKWQWDKSNLNQVKLAKGRMPIPDRLQSPAMELSEDELNFSLRVFEASLRTILNKIPEAKFRIVYIPSPLASYSYANNSVSIEVYQNGKKEQSSSDVWPRSADIAARVKDITLRNNVSFINTTPSIQELGATNIIHGPQDWYHFNRQGYERLAKAILDNSQL